MARRLQHTRGASKRPSDIQLLSRPKPSVQTIEKLLRGKRSLRGQILRLGEDAWLLADAKGTVHKLNLENVRGAGAFHVNDEILLRKGEQSKLFITRATHLPAI
jgi:hypothetical protein